MSYSYAIGALGKRETVSGNAFPDQRAAALYVASQLGMTENETRSLAADGYACVVRPLGFREARSVCAHAWVGPTAEVLLRKSVGASECLAEYVLTECPSDAVLGLTDALASVESWPAMGAALRVWSDANDPDAEVTSLFLSFCEDALLLHQWESVHAGFYADELADQESE